MGEIDRRIYRIEWVMSVVSLNLLMFPAHDLGRKDLAQCRAIAPFLSLPANQIASAGLPSACWPLDASTPATHLLRSKTSFRPNLPRLPASSLSLWPRLPHHGQILWSCGGCRRDCHLEWVGRLARLPGERAQAPSSAPTRSPRATRIAPSPSPRDPYPHPPFRPW